MSDKKKHESFTEHVVDTTTDIEYVDVGTAEDVEKLPLLHLFHSVLCRRA